MLFFHNLFSHFQTVGLLLDILGAFYLAKSFIFSKPEDLIAQSYGTDYPEKGLTSALSGNLFRGFYRQSREARVGFIFLPLGFIGQTLGALFPTFTFCYLIGLIVIILALLVPPMILNYIFEESRIAKLERGTDEKMSKNSNNSINK